jgi:eukaryotic-like serine/threonine-protein kinase
MSAIPPALQLFLADRYTIEQEIGRGGMAAVYLARDIRHERRVAIKVLDPALAAALGAERFLREIRIVAGLQHPHILPLYDSGEGAGFLYYVMPFVEGESLRQRLTREKQLPLEDALRIGREVADALAYAHGHHVVHRDIKPENILLETGHAVVADFGIARAIGAVGDDQLTQTGMALGTPAYMSPEQAAASAEVDGRSDVYALSCVLYELLAGQPPFTGPTAEIVVRQHLVAEPPDVTRLRPSVPARVATVLLRGMAKTPADRFMSAQAFLDALQNAETAAQAVVTPPAPDPGAAATPRPDAPGPGRRRRGLRPGVMAGVVLLVLAGTSVPAMRTARVVWARSHALASLNDHVAVGDWEAAHRLANRVAAILPGDPRVEAARAVVSDTIAVEGDPGGARIYRRPYGGADSDWELLGHAPLGEAIVPRFPAISEFRIEADGFAPAYDIGAAPAQRIVTGPTLRYTLVRPDEAPAGMVRVGGGDAGTEMAQLNPSDRARLGDFWLDRFEVTNRDYQEFVDAGGYRDRHWWEHEFLDGDRRLTFEEATARFVDRTGRPGPASWEAGRYPREQGDHPVGGVSWYEAAAYAKFRGRRLPNVFEWVRAARLGASGSIVMASNIGGASDGTAPVGAFRGISGWGALDMAGNVREWCFNESRTAGGHYLLGGSWADPSYAFFTRAIHPPLDRSPTNGMRLALSIADQPGDGTGDRPLEPLSRDYTVERPVSDEVFGFYRGQFAYDPRPLREQVELRDSSDQWVVEKVSFDAAYGTERMAAYLYLPAGVQPPYQTVLYFPGSTTLSVRSSAHLGTPPTTVDYLVQNGRAVIHPILQGTYERDIGRAVSDPDESHAYREWVIQLRKDVSRALDYLATRADIDTSRIGYMGYSWGGRVGGIMLALEPRFDAAVLAVAGLNAGRALPEVDDLNYVPRVRVPVLMLNGRHDPTFPLEAQALPMFELLGTPPEHKRNVIVDGAHFVPRHVLIRETLAWFDRYLGPVR